MKSLRGASLIVPALLLALSFAQRPGETTFDTKFDLTAGPGRLLARSLSLWNPQSSFGELQNQAYGYLFPQGPFFWVGDLAGLPDWVVQRLWSGLLLVAAYEGARRLFRCLAPAGQYAAAVAGLGYALAPRMLGLDGVLTGEVLPTAVLPWVILPLVAAQQGRRSPRSAGLLSGTAVLAMGGVNAVEVLAALPLALFVAVSGARRPGGRALLAWWAAGVGLASLWWLLPLLVLGRYSPPFLNYIETAQATTGVLGWTNVMRGADHWVGFVTVGGQPWWPAAYELFTTWWGILFTSGVAGVSLVGLLRRDMPMRTALLGSALLGVLLLSVGRGGALGSPVAGEVRDLLDGPLAALRNVHKVDPLVRLPLAMGLGHAVSTCVAALKARATPGRGGSQLRLAALYGLVAVLLVGSAVPLLTGSMRKPGWAEVPHAWRAAVDYVERERGDGRVLVLPGSGFAEQFWGSTIDEPIQGLADVPWVTRSQVPLAPGPTIRFLDGVEDRVADGIGSPALADALARAGITLVLVRRDLREGATDAPPPERVDLALRRSPGLTSVARFGRSIFGMPSMIEVFRVEPEVSADPRADATVLSDAVTMAGDSGDVLTALEAGVLDPRRPVLFGQGGRGRVLSLQGDGYRRVERQFGRVHDAVGQVMSADDRPRIERPVMDFPGPDGQRRATFFHDSIISMTASSSAGYADTAGPSVPERGPYSAVDGSLSTYWQSAPLRRPTGAWLQLRLREPIPVERVEVRMGVGASGVSVREIELRADDQVRRATVDPVSGRAVVELDGAPVRSLRVTVTKTLGDPAEGVVAIREVTVPGMATTGSLVVPEAGAGARTTFVLRADPPRTTCIATAQQGAAAPVCRPLSARPGEAEDRLSRQLTIGEPGSWFVRGTVVSKPTASARRLTEPLGGAVRVRSGSVLNNDLLLNPQRAYDADPNTWWTSAPGDPDPTLRLRWGRPRTLRRIQVEAGPDGVLPGSLLLRAGTRQRRVDLQGSFGFFRPLTTDRLQVTFDRAADGTVDGRSVSVAEMRIAGLDDLRYRPDLDARTGSRCGLGPPVLVDGRTVATRVTGSMADLLTGAPLQLRSCAGTARMRAGVHRIDTVATAQFTPVTTVLTPGAPGRALSSDRPPRRRSVEVATWTSERRTLQVGPGDPAVLRLTENVNPGWSATLNGRRLRPVTVDGWQQGYVVPAGRGGRVEIVFGPARWYRAGLVIGAIGAVALVSATALVLLLERRRRSLVGRTATAPALSGRGREPVARRGWRRGVRDLALLTLVGVLGGVAVLGGVVGAGAAGSAGAGRRALPAVAGGLVAGAGALAAVGTLAGLDLRGVADLLAGSAAGVMVALALPAPRLWRRNRNG